MIAWCAFVRAKHLSFWSEFASACAAQVHSLCAFVAAVYLPFFVFETGPEGPELED